MINSLNAVASATRPALPANALSMDALAAMQGRAAPEQVDLE